MNKPIIIKVNKKGKYIFFIPQYLEPEKVTAIREELEKFFIDDKHTFFFYGKDADKIRIKFIKQVNSRKYIPLNRKKE